MNDNEILARLDFRAPIPTWQILIHSAAVGMLLDMAGHFLAFIGKGI